MAQPNVSLVEVIKRLLFDGRSTDINLILKELVQNADDAFVRSENDAQLPRLAFGFHSGLKGAAHPLLADPGFFAVNSGPFKPEDAAGVLSLAESPKIDDPASIGKFGIGLKSVFYYGEVFFFLCRSQDDLGRTLEPLADVFNPYNEPRKNIRPLWEEFGPNDRTLMRQALTELGVFDGFVIWVPLRTTQATMLDGKTIAIDPGRPGDRPEEFVTRLSSSDVLDRLRRAMPLLRHIQTIEVFCPGNNSSLIGHFDGRSLYPKVIGEHSYAGEITLSASAPYVFGATESQPQDAVFGDIQSSPFWAMSTRADHSEQIVDKTQPHASVTFARRSATSGSLKTQWAVFLPLGEPDVQPCDGETEFCLTLHGSFFVNSDRRTILDWSQPPAQASSSGDLQAMWNAEVANRGIFPLLLPTLAHFAEQLSFVEQEQLTAAVSKLSLFHAHRAFICENVQWVRVFTATQPEWQLLPAARSLLGLPFLPEVMSWLPGMARLSDEGRLAVSDAPHLKKGPLSGWTLEDAETLFSGLKVETLRAQQVKHLGAIIDVVSSRDTRPAVLAVLRRLMLVPKGALAQPQLHEALAALASKLRPAERFIVPVNQNAELRGQLSALTVNVVLVPGELLEQSQHGMLSVQEAHAILTALRHAPGKDAFRSRVVNAVESGQRAELTESVQLLEIMEVDGGNSGFRRLITLVQAQALAAHDHLYTEASVSDQSGRSWLDLAQSLFPDYHLDITTSGSVMRALTTQALKPLGEDAVLSLLGGSLNLGTDQARVDVLQELAPSILKRTDAKDRRAFRYLIHGDRRAGDEPIYTLGRAVPTLQKLATLIFGMRGEGWRIVSPYLAGQLSDPQKDQLKVLALGLDELEVEIARSVGEDGTVALDSTAFTEAERHELIRQLSDDLLRKLPLLETTQGGFTVLDSTCFLPGEISFPPAVTGTVIFVRPVAELADRFNELKIRPLTAEALIRHLLKREQPEYHAAWILVQLGDMKAAPLGLLRSVKWLRSRDGRVFSPDQVIDLPPVEEVVSTCLEDPDKEYVSPPHLHASVSTTGLETLRRLALFPDAERAVAILGRLLREDVRHTYATGNIDLVGQQLTYDTWHELFSQVPQDVLPSRNLLERLARWEDHKSTADQLYEDLRFPFRPECLPDVLNGLGHKLKNQSKVREELHRAYLAELVEQGGWSGAAPKLVLPSAAGSWRPAGELCLEAPGIPDHAQLAAEWRSVLQQVAQPAPETGDDDHLPAEELVTQRGVQELVGMFQRWGDQVEGVLIGAFLSVLGGHDTMQGPVAAFLGASEDADMVRRKLVGAWQEPGRTGRTFDQFIKRVWVVPVLSHDPVVMVTSLTGQPLEVRRNQSADLLTGQPAIQLLSGARFDFKVTLRINDLSQEGLNGDDLSRALLEATRDVLKFVYHCVPENLDEAWKELDDAAQFDLELAQDLIIDDGMVYVNHQLRLQKDHPLKVMFEERRHLRAQEKRLDQAKEPTRELKLKLVGILKKFRALLDAGDPETAQALLEGVKKRVLEAKYEPVSVPFEIFQNADDAALQLQAMREGQAFSPRPEEDLFVVEQDTQAVTFMHWGRAINQYALGTFTDANYQLDLNNMLLLAASDKGDEEISTTGRFGMGFKSSYLLTDVPQIVSAKLAFEVTGGLYPRRLPMKDEAALRTQLRAYGEPVRGTAIRLTTSDSTLVDHALAHFRDWAPITLMFAKAVRRLVLDGVTLSWNQTVLTSTLSFWKLEPGHSLLSRALVFDLPSGTVLIPVGTSGINTLPDEVPTLWVLAPTQSRAQAGLAINARFAVDIGRSEVTSQAQENHDLIDRLAAEVEPALLGLYETSTDWATFQQVLHLNSDVTFEGFWRGMWQLLAERQATILENFAGQLVRRVFWGSGGARALVDSRAVMPNGLTGHHDVLTSISSLKFVVTGVLTQPTMLEAQVSLEDLPPGVLVHERVWALLETLLDGGKGLRHVPLLMLVDVVRRRFGLDPQVRHGDEPRAVPPPEQLEADKEEIAALRAYLDTFRFESATGALVLARELLIAHSHSENPSEEALRAAFAPARNLLHPERTPEVERLFRICRRDLPRSIELLSGWAAEASDDQKKAVLTYVIKSSQGADLAQHDAFRDIPWIRSLLNLPLFYQLTENDRFTLVGQLGRADEYKARILNTQSTISTPVQVSRSADPKGELERLYERWELEREQLLKAFELKRYPSFMHDGIGLKDPWSDREQWMGLFLIGSYMTLGRIETGTRSFLEKAHHAGWIQTFCAEILDAERWFAILDTFVENEDAQYRQWINRFLATYQISRHLGDYIYLFQSASFASEALTLPDLLDVRESHLYTGTGLDVPSIRSALGIGQHFVLRELVRRGVIDNRHLDAQCYVPTKKVRERLYALGCDIPTDDWDMHTSRTIATFLESHLGADRARFHGDFDLPFVLLG